MRGGQPPYKLTVLPKAVSSISFDQLSRYRSVFFGRHSPIICSHFGKWLVLFRQNPPKSVSFSTGDFVSIITIRGPPRERARELPHRMRSRGLGVPSQLRKSHSFIERSRFLIGLIPANFGLAFFRIIHSMSRPERTSCVSFLFWSPSCAAFGLGRRLTKASFLIYCSPPISPIPRSSFHPPAPTRLTRYRQMIIRASHVFFGFRNGFRFLELLALGRCCINRFCHSMHTNVTTDTWSHLPPDSLMVLPTNIRTRMHSYPGACCDLFFFFGLLVRSLDFRHLVHARCGGAS